MVLPTLPEASHNPFEPRFSGFLELPGFCAVPPSRPGATTTLHGATHPAGGDNCALSRPAGTLSEGTLAQA